jgi:hypothetical protein
VDAPLNNQEKIPSKTSWLRAEQRKRQNHTRPAFGPALCCHNRKDGFFLFFFSGRLFPHVRRLSSFHLPLILLHRDIPPRSSHAVAERDETPEVSSLSVCEATLSYHASLKERASRAFFPFHLTGILDARIRRRYRRGFGFRRVIVYGRVCLDLSFRTGLAAAASGKQGEEKASAQDEK